MSKKPLQTNGVILKGQISPSSGGNIDDISHGIFLDSEGNIVFKDDFVVNFLNKEGVTLKELYTRLKGIYYRDGSLVFKDETVNRPYSLQEIINAIDTIKNGSAGGSLWWMGSKKTNHLECANLPDEKIPRDLVYWSIDKYLTQTSDISCSTTEDLDITDKFSDRDTGEWKWWDVQNMEIVIPPILDYNKVASIRAKLSYFQRNGREPIVFRLYDSTAGKELTRVAVVQDNCYYHGMPVVLDYLGPLALSQNLQVKQGCVIDESCGCVDTTCIDPSCMIPEPSYIRKTFKQESHLIKVQFHVFNYHENHWDRIMGASQDGISATESSVNAIIFDIANGKYIRKHGSQQFIRQKSNRVIFKEPLPTKNYTINFSSDRNINLWFSNKDETGFTINAEIEMTGIVDWVLVNID